MNRNGDQRTQSHGPDGPEMLPHLPVTLDVVRARKETPGCSNVVHLNNAGAALPPAAVTDAVIAHLRLEAQIGGYEAAAVAAPAVIDVYHAIARLIGCQPHEVAVVENATRAWDMAFYAMRFGPGDRILTARTEYASNVIAFLQTAARTDAQIEVVDNDEHGQLSVEDLRRRLNDDVKLAAVSHVPTHSGLVNPAVEIGRLTRAAGVPFLLDACQSVGQIPIDVDEIGCDMLSATGRKFLRGPRGTGFLYVADRLIGQLEPPFLDLHAATWTAEHEYEIRPDARRFENWETYYAAKIGLGVAVDYALDWGMQAIEERVTALAGRLRQRLAELPGVTVQDHGQRLCGIVTFTVDDVSAADVQSRLTAGGINTSVVAVGSARYDLAARGLPAVVRASVHYYNTDDEIEQLCAALSRLPKGWR
jgi:selenocysteine lyase/cysteine desulfurase